MLTLPLSKSCGSVAFVAPSGMHLGTTHTEYQARPTLCAASVAEKKKATNRTKCNQANFSNFIALTHATDVGDASKHGERSPRRH